MYNKKIGFFFLSGVVGLEFVSGPSDYGVNENWLDVLFKIQL